MTKIDHLRIVEPLEYLFSSRDADYMKDPQRFQPWLSYQPSLDNLKSVVLEKAQSYPDTVRSTLVNVLKDQCHAIDHNSQITTSQMERLQSDKTFVTITAHQPCLFTGPLYVIYKISSAIALAKKCKATLPDYDFVPVYVLGGEDHDLEEVNHLHLFNKKITWETEQAGSVGRMSLTDIEQVIDEVQQFISNEEYSEQIIEKLKNSFKSSRSLGQGTMKFIYELFADHGLIIANLDDPRLKKYGADIFRNELENRFSNDLVVQEQQALEKLGYSSQVYPREINLFYLDDNQRDRIEKIDGGFRVSEKEFTDHEMLNLLDNKPECFSPNVILRPVYQQSVLPGVAFIGGGAEVSYWMELSAVFEECKVPQPLILRRDSAIWIKPYTADMMKKTGIGINQLFQPLHELKEAYLRDNAESDWNLSRYKTELQQLFEDLFEEVKRIDEGLVKKAKGMQAQHENNIDTLEAKLRRSLKNQHDAAMRKLDKIWADLFPNNGLQERSANFISIYSRLGDRLITELIDQFDPEEKGLHVYIEGNLES